MADERTLASQTLKTRLKDYVIDVKKGPEEGWRVVLRSVFKDPSRNRDFEVPEEDFDRLMKTLQDVTRLLEKTKRKPSQDPRDKGHEKPHRAWTDGEAKAVGAAFHDGVSFKKLALESGRSVGSIKTQLTKMGYL